MCSRAPPKNTSKSNFGQNTDDDDDDGGDDGDEAMMMAMMMAMMTCSYVFHKPSFIIASIAESSWICGKSANIDTL